MSPEEKISAKSPVRPAATAAWAAATALGAVGSLGTGSDAQAEIVHVNQTLTLTNGSTWRLEGAGGTTALGNVLLSTAYNFFPRQAFNGFRLADQNNETVRNLAVGTPVSGAVFTGIRDGVNVSWRPNGAGVRAGFAWDLFTIGTSAFAGFRFNLGNGTQYGWVNLTILPNLGGVRLNGWAYETTVGASIPVGATIPEPGTNALLGLGALALGISGLRAYKAQRRAAAALAA